MTGSNGIAAAVCRARPSWIAEDGGGDRAGEVRVDTRQRVAAYRSGTASSAAGVSPRSAPASQW